MLFRKKIQRSCSYCARGGKVDESTVLCVKKGFVEACSSCRHFQYDPLRRVPARPKPQNFERFSDEEFKL